MYSITHRTDNIAIGYLTVPVITIASLLYPLELTAAEPLLRSLRHLTNFGG